LKIINIEDWLLRTTRRIK